MTDEEKRALHDSLDDLTNQALKLIASISGTKALGLGWIDRKKPSILRETNYTNLLDTMLRLENELKSVRESLPTRLNVAKTIAAGETFSDLYVDSMKAIDLFEESVARFCESIVVGSVLSKSAGDIIVPIPQLSKLDEMFIDYVRLKDLIEAAFLRGIEAHGGGDAKPEVVCLELRRHTVMRPRLVLVIEYKVELPSS